MMYLWVSYMKIFFLTSFKSLKKGVGSGSAPKCHGSPTLCVSMALEQVSSSCIRASFAVSGSTFRACRSGSGSVSISPAGEGLGESQFRRLEKKLSTLPILWYLYSNSWSVDLPRKQLTQASQLRSAQAKETKKHGFKVTVTQFEREHCPNWDVYKSKKNKFALKG
jgi:hypothetical protein